MMDGVDLTVDNKNKKSRRHFKMKMKILRSWRSYEFVYLISVQPRMHLNFFMNINMLINMHSPPPSHRTSFHNFKNVLLIYLISIPRKYNLILSRLQMKLILLWYEIVISTNFHFFLKKSLEILKTYKGLVELNVHLINMIFILQHYN